MPVTIPQGVICFWPSTNASIPSGWQRETALDGQHIHVNQSASSAGTTGGAATHTHVENSHTHTSSLGSGTGSRQKAAGETKNKVATYTHSHSQTTSSSATNTLAAANNDPYWYKVIFIKPAGGATPTGIPDGAQVFYAEPSGTPTNWTNPVAAKGNFIKGADAEGNGGSVGGGNGDHVHSESRVSHADFNSSLNSASSINVGSDPTTHLFALDGHAHVCHFAAGSAADSSSANSTPAYTTLRLIQNGTGGAALLDKAIYLWLGSEASIPAGWYKYATPAGADFVYVANQIGDVGVTGGTRAHTHTVTQHNHAVTYDTANLVNGVDSGTGSNYSSNTHTHSSANCGNTTPTLQTLADRAAYPSYTEVVLVQYLAPVTIALDPISLSPGLQTSVIIPDPVTIALQPLALQMQAQSSQVAPGAAIVPLSALAAALACLDLSIQPGAAAVALGALGVSLGLGAATVVPDPVIATLQPLAASLALQGIVPTTGEIRVLLEAFHASLGLRAIQVAPGAASVALGPLSAILSANSVTIEPGSVAVLLEALGTRIDLQGVTLEGGIPSIIISLEPLGVRLVTGELRIILGLILLPDGRAIAILRENRIFAIDAEGRILPQGAEQRIFPANLDERSTN